MGKDKNLGESQSTFSPSYLVKNLATFFEAGTTQIPMATCRVVLDKRRKLKNGSHPLVVRIFKGNVFKDINLKIPLFENQFDAEAQKVNGNCPNRKLVNQKIQQALLQAQGASLSLELSEDIVSAKKIRSAIVKPTCKLNFLQYGEKVIADMREANRNGNANAYRDALNALRTYSGRSDLQFQELDYEMLCRLENKMLAAGLKKNSIACYNRALRAIYNKAINEDLVEVKYYPYRKFKLRTEATAKRNISREDIAAVARAELPVNGLQFHARNYFILSFNLRGISFADMVTIRPEDITNGRLIYKRKKTHKLYNVKLTDKAAEILRYYQHPDRAYILPVIPEHAVNNQVEERKYTQYGTKTTNWHLRSLAKALKIDQPISTYYARHSWATVAKKMGYSKDMISEALGHSHGSRITEVYLDSYDQEVIDAMNEAVCKF